MATENSPTTNSQIETENLDDFLFHSIDFAYRKKKLLITIGVIFVLAFIIWFLAYKYLEYQEDSRNNQLYQVEKIIFDQKLVPAERDQAALKAIKSFVAENRGSKQANIALFHEAKIYFHQSELDLAATSYQKILSNLDRNSSFYVIASIYLANVLKDQKKPDQAIEVLNAAKTENMYDVILMELAETYHSINDKPSAKKTLENLIADFPSSNYTQRAKEMLSQY
ncbi:MAG: tetratricopeptide repeat protein [Deltaproteobacteria bacterium]|nr:tetratricopeptide repeat protein [Deltaproteobacteria bacterium]